MFGQLKLENFNEADLPQKGTTAWQGATMSELTGKSYKALLYLGAQPVNGIMHWFIAEQSDVYPPFARRVIKMAILEKDGEFSFEEKSIFYITQ